jgi:hypothetical protein
VALTKNGLSFISKFDNNSILILDGTHPDEMQTGRAVFDLLRDLQSDESKFDCRRFEVKDKEALFSQLAQLQAEAAFGLRPIIHLEMHGNHQGMIVGQNRDQVLWEELIPKLREINIASKYNLGIVMSGCCGLYAIRPITIHLASPFQFLLGTQRTVNAGPLNDALKVFYAGLVETSDIIAAMNGVPEEFKPFLAEKMAAISYAKYLKNDLAGPGRVARVARHTSIVSHLAHNRAQRRGLRKKALEFARPRKAHFDKFIKTFLPRGCGFSFQDLLLFVKR